MAHRFPEFKREIVTYVEPTDIVGYVPFIIYKTNVH